MKKKAELLMPAGCLERLKAAILYGADAVYLGTPDMSLRTKSSFTLDEVVEGINFAHAKGKKVYLTLNLFTHNKDIVKLAEYVATVRKVKPDGLIVADPGVFQYIKENAPELELHISTQANLCSWLSVKFWQQQGASLCVMAREVSYQELKEIREQCPDIKLEAFVHGSMCMTYSGRCMLSNYMVERGANQGNCANSCRWNYKMHVRMKDGSIKELCLDDHTKDMFEFYLEEGYRPGELMQIEEDDKGTYILNSKDLCLMSKLDDYLKIGIDSLKVEGRNKSIYYVAMVARAYRMAIDAWYEDADNWQSDEYMKELDMVANRGYTLAFHEGRLTNLAHNYDDTHSLSEWEFAGQVTKFDDEALYVLVKNKIIAGDVLEFVSPFVKDTVLLRIYEFLHVKNGQVVKVTEDVHAGQMPIIKVPFAWFDKENIENIKGLFPEFSIVKKEKALTKEEWARLKLDGEALQREQNKGNAVSYDRKRKKLQEEIKKADSLKSFKTPRFGVQGCCGRGCNGCLVFWHDPLYEKARTILAGKKQGEMLEKHKMAVVG